MSLDWEYCEEGQNPTLGEEVIFGADEKRRFYVPTSDFTITSTSVSADPLTRTMFRIIGSKDSSGTTKNFVSIIDISPINKKTNDEVQRFIQQLVTTHDGAPWRTSHPRFQVSPFLRYKTALLWKYWLSNHAGPSPDD